MQNENFPAQRFRDNGYSSLESAWTHVTEALDPEANQRELRAPGEPPLIGKLPDASNHPGWPISAELGPAARDLADAATADQRSADAAFGNAVEHQKAAGSVLSELAKGMPAEPYDRLKFLETTRLQGKALTHLDKAAKFQTDAWLKLNAAVAAQRRQQLPRSLDLELRATQQGNLLRENLDAAEIQLDAKSKAQDARNQLQIRLEMRKNPEMVHALNQEQQRLTGRIASLQSNQSVAAGSPQVTKIEQQVDAASMRLAGAPTSVGQSSQPARAHSPLGLQQPQASPQR
ncbi:hypothetical protein [Micromonospora sp. SH-82]|uniref:hypothetical protein n=1 Tax=Micromonospora sp. SH-82 TaxID=3132938 RepID=UPI003EBD8F45